MHVQDEMRISSRFSKKQLIIVAKKAMENFNSLYKDSNPDDLA